MSQNFLNGLLAAFIFLSAPLFSYFEPKDRECLIACLDLVPAYQKKLTENLRRFLSSQEYVKLNNEVDFLKRNCGGMYKTSFELEEFFSLYMLTRLKNTYKAPRRHTI